MAVVAGLRFDITPGTRGHAVVLRCGKPLDGIGEALWTVIKIVLASPHHQVSLNEYLKQRGGLPNPNAESTNRLRQAVHRLKAVLPEFALKAVGSQTWRLVPEVRHDLRYTRVTANNASATDI